MKLTNSKLFILILKFFLDILLKVLNRGYDKRGRLHRF